MSSHEPLLAAAGKDRLPDAASHGTDPAHLDELAATGEPRLRIDRLAAGYGRGDILHGIDLRLAAGQSLCLVGPNGAGKSTVLNAIFGLADVHGGTMAVDGRVIDPRWPAVERMTRCRIAYVLQESSIFPDLSVEQNLRLGGYALDDRAQVTGLVEAILQQHPRLADRRQAQAKVLSGGERRLLEIVRALMLRPRLLLIDEPSIGLEPRAVVQVFDMLRALQASDGLSILLVEQNVRQGLAFADLGYAMVGGRVVAAGRGSELLRDPAIGSLFLGA
ncbi:MAG: ABC transporter ATP-binding protein [Rubrivivax sp.]|nr:ABC transporter ATP-binding protein [Rubrivivax sp.]